MTLGTYLLIALVIAACIPVVEMIAKRLYGRDLTLPWPQPLIPDALPEREAAHPLVNERARAHSEQGWVTFDMSGMPADIQAKMKDLTIGFDGRQYTFAGYHYDRVSDAIQYAELQQVRRQR